MINQYTQIKDYLDQHPEGITPMDAWNHLYITKLSTRIGEMIRMGYKIEKFPESRVNEQGQTKRYTRYKKAV